MKVNFKRVKFYTGIDRKELEEKDISLDIANMIYNHWDVRGIRLAEKIYLSDGDIELTNEEVAVILNLSNQHGTARLVDAINNLFNINTDNNERV